MSFNKGFSKIVITGGNGFIGTRLLKNKALKDSLAIGRTKPQNHSNFIKVNLTEDDKLSEILFEKDVVIHLAAKTPTINNKSSDSILSYRKVNTEETLNLAKKAAVSGVKRFIFISTVKVLGEKTISGLSFKNDDTLRPQDPYSVSKAEAEEGLKKIGKIHGMEIVIIRPPLVFGNGAKGNLRSLINLINLPIPLPLKSIKNKRSLVGIDNLVDLIINCIDHPKAGNETFMVSDDHDLSTPDLILMLSKAGGKRKFLFHFPLIMIYILLKILGKLSTYKRLCSSMTVNIEHTKKQLNWKPPFKLEDSFRDCWLK